MRKIGRILTLLICALLICSVSACAGSADDDSPVLKLGYLPITHSALPLILYEKNQGSLENFNLEMIRFSNWAEMAEAIQAGRIDGGGSILNTLAIRIAANGVPFQAVLMAHREGNVFIISRNIDDAADLMGKTIAIPSRFSPHYSILHQYLLERGLEPGVDVLTPDMAPPDMVQALASGSIDGYVVAEPFGVQAEVLGVGGVLMLSKDIDLPASRSNGCTISIREEFIQQHPDAVQEFVEGLIETGIWLESHPEEGADLLAPYLGMNGDMITKSFIDPPGRTSFLDLYPRVEEYITLQETYLSIGLLEEGIDMDWFIEESFAEEVYQKLDLEQLEW